MYFLLISCLFFYIGFKIYRKFNLLDKPKEYGFKRKPVPYSFGLVLYFIFLIASYFYGVDIVGLYYIYIASFLIVLIAFVDDFLNLHPLFRLLSQLLLACFVVYSGVELTQVTNPFNFEIVSIGGFGFLVSVLWIVFLTNVMNFLDGVEGLSSGVSSVAFFTLGILSLVPKLHLIDQSSLIVLTFLMSAICFLAFLFEFPRPNPKILVGDSGTMFYGFLLACFSMVAGGKLFTLLIVLLIPILDALFVIFYRISKKKLPFIGDRNHFHHKLLELNFSRAKITLIYFLVSICLGLISIFAWNTFLKLISLLVICVSFSYLMYVVWRRSKV